MLNIKNEIWRRSQTADCFCRKAPSEEGLHFIFETLKRGLKQNLEPSCGMSELT